MRTLLALLCFLIVLPSGSAAPATDRVWIASQKDAAAQAAAAGKPLLVYLHADYCEWCRVMERTTFQDSRVRLLVGQYVPCRLNGEREGKPLIQRYQVAAYPFLAVTDATGSLSAQVTGLQDADACARWLSASLPADAVTRLEGVCAAHPEDARSRAALAVIRAERGEAADVARSLSVLSAGPAPPSDLMAAVGHALGLAYSARGDDSDAVPCLQDAVKAATDPRETVRLHLLLAASLLRLRRRDDAVAQLEIVRNWSQATKDEKKEAKAQQDRLSVSQNG